MRTIIAVFLFCVFLCFTLTPAPAVAQAANVTPQFLPYIGEESQPIIQLESVNIPLRDFYEIPTTTDPADVTTLQNEVEAVRTAGDIPPNLRSILIQILLILIRIAGNVP